MELKDGNDAQPLAPRPDSGELRGRPHLGVTRTALSRVLHGHAAISAEMALRIGKTFNTDPQMWLSLQMQRDLWEASQKKIKAKPIAKAAA
jgi:plasmid maintenance system antidote protein VapI